MLPNEWKATRSSCRRNAGTSTIFQLAHCFLSSGSCTIHSGDGLRCSGNSQRWFVLGLQKNEAINVYRLLSIVLRIKTLYIPPPIHDSPISTNCGTEGFFLTSVRGQVNNFYPPPAFWENWCISHFCKLLCKFNWHFWRCRWRTGTKLLDKVTNTSS